MKRKLTVTLLFCIVLSSCSFNTQNNNKTLFDYDGNKSLFNKYNAIRVKANQNEIYHDTILDEICKVLLTNCNYKNENNEFKEDSIHSLFYRFGIIDYQYNLAYFSDNDTLSKFRDFILSDNFPFIQMGYAKEKNNHILLKTKKYLKFHHAEVTAHSNEVDPLNNSKINHNIFVTNDSIKYYFKKLIPDDYYCYFSNHIPLEDNNIVGTIDYVKVVNNYEGNYDIVFISKKKETNMYLIAINKNNNIITALK